MLPGAKSIILYFIWPVGDDYKTSHLKKIFFGKFNNVLSEHCSIDLKGSQNIQGLALRRAVLSKLGY